MHNVRHDGDLDGMDSDELGNSRNLPSCPLPAKHSVIGERVALSPSKTNGQNGSYTLQRAFWVSLVLLGS